MPGKPFSLAYKQQMVAKLLGKDAGTARSVAKEHGVSHATMSRWLREARSLAGMPTNPNSRPARSIDDKVRILSEAAKLTGPELTAYLEREDVLLADLEQWRLALDEEGRASSATHKRIKNLERELARKEKALAEAAALLVLKKKLQHLLEDEDDDTDEKNEP